MDIENNFYEQLKQLYSGSNFSLNQATFLPTLLKAMELVESCKNLPGLEKKELVKSLMCKLLNDLQVDSDFVSLKDYYLQNSTLLDAHIDTFISVSKGVYALNKTSINSIIKKVKCFVSRFSCTK